MSQKYLSKFRITLKEGNNATETYRVPEELFKNIQESLSFYRSESPAPIAIKCIETGECFNCAKAAAVWLQKMGIPITYTAPTRIKNACRKQNLVYGYHWEFIK